MEDVPKDMKVLKILGMLNSDWKQEWGGGFTWNDKTYYAKPGSFYVFDPRNISRKLMKNCLRRNPRRQLHLWRKMIILKLMSQRS